MNPPPVPRRNPVARFFVGLWDVMNFTRRLILNLMFFGLLFLMLIVMLVAMGKGASSAKVLHERTTLVIAPEGRLVEQYSTDPVSRALAKAMGESNAEEIQLRDLVRAIHIHTQCLDAVEIDHFDADRPEPGRARLGARHRGIDALLLGRRTYDIFAAHWPYVEKNDPIGPLFDRIDKYVATRNPGFKTTWQNSHVLGPQGEFIAEAGLDPTILLAEVDMARSEHVRRIWPFLRDRRIDAYGDLTKRYRDF